nr:PREDICTED: cell division cycle protein 16 homolog [Bemisia tabaci]
MESNPVASCSKTTVEVSKQVASVDEEMKSKVEFHPKVEAYRKLVWRGIHYGRYSEALFWAEQAMFLSNEDQCDVYLCAKCMFLNEDYHRAYHLITSRGLEKINQLCLYIAAKCLFEAKDFSGALDILIRNEEEVSIPSCSLMEPQDRGHELIESDDDDDDDDEEDDEEDNDDDDDEEENVEDEERADAGIGEEEVNGEECEFEDDDPFHSPMVESDILFLKGQIYQEMNFLEYSSNSFKQTLMKDIYHAGAFTALTKHQMLTENEESDLLDSLDSFSSNSNSEDVKFVKSLYANILYKYKKPPEIDPDLEESCDILIAKAQRLYYECRYQQCFDIVDQVLKRDIYHPSALLLRIVCLVELNKTNKLFYLAQKLVKTQPEEALSWFAVGCYYYATGKNDPARKYFTKATALDKLFGPAWLAYGHSFAADGEHDQAMAAYFKAHQIMKGCHLPLLYLSLECAFTSNLKLAENYVKQAAKISKNDPFVMHEMGVIAFYNQDYVAAENFFEQTLSRVREINESLISEKWGSLLNNLGHTCRKLKKYDKALEYHHQALLLSPLNASILTCIGFVQALMGDNMTALETLHKSLSLCRDNAFTITMISYVADALVQVSPVSDGEESQDSSYLMEISKPAKELSEDSDMSSKMVISTESVSKNLFGGA